MIALSAGFCGLAVPATYTLAQDIIPERIVASGIGVLNGIANTIGALAPFAMGVIISMNNNNFTAGLMVLVFGSLACTLAIVPLLRRH
jgi:cyanate permease